MKNLLQIELDQVQKSLRMQQYLFLLLIVIGVTSSFISYNMGRINQESKVLHRASKLIDSKKTCYDSADIEIVALGETQP